MKILQILILIFSFTIFVSAQKTTLTGTVYDDNGAVVKDAKVSLRGKDSVEQSVITNEEGVFEINLSAGNYSIEVSSKPFLPFKLEKYRVVPSYKGKMILDVVLEVLRCDPCEITASTVIKENNNRKNNK